MLSLNKALNSVRNRRNVVSAKENIKAYGQEDNEMIKWYVLIIEAGKPVFITSLGDFSEYAYYTPGDKPLDLQSADRAKTITGCLKQQGITAYVVYSYREELEQPTSDFVEVIKWPL